MKTRPDPEKSRTIEKSRKRTKRINTEVGECADTKGSQDKTANRKNGARLKEKSQPRQDSRYLKRTPRSKDLNAKSRAVASQEHQELENKSKKSSNRVREKLLFTETNEDLMNLDDSSALGNGMIQDALESTKFVEAKYLEVLTRMQEMKKKDKKFHESRVRTIESTVDRLTKENENLKYQLSNLQDAINEKKEDSDSKKESTTREIQLSIRKFEEKESALYGRIKELELLIKQSGLLSQNPPTGEQKETSTSNSCSKTTVNHIQKRDKTPPKRPSLLSNKTHKERTPSPGNFKRLLNQAAEQLINDPIVGHKATASKANQKFPQSHRPSRPEGSLRDAGFSNHQLLKSHDRSDVGTVESVKHTVDEMVREFRSMRRESREVSSKLANIEKVLER